MDNRDRGVDRVHPNWTGNLVTCSANLGYLRRRTEPPRPSTHPLIQSPAICLSPIFRFRENQNRRLARRCDPLENRRKYRLPSANQVTLGCLRTDAKPIGESSGANATRHDASCRPFAVTFSWRVVLTVGLSLSRPNHRYSSSVYVAVLFPPSTCHLSSSFLPSFSLTLSLSLPLPVTLSFTFSFLCVIIRNIEHSFILRRYIRWHLLLCRQLITIARGQREKNIREAYVTERSSNKGTRKNLFERGNILE